MCVCVCVCVCARARTCVLCCGFIHVRLLATPMHCSPPGSSVHEALQTRMLEWVAMPFSRDLPDPGIKPRSPASPALQVDSLPLSHRGSLPKLIYKTSNSKKKKKKKTSNSNHCLESHFSVNFHACMYIKHLSFLL